MYAQYQKALRELETVKHFIKHSRRFPLTGSGTINLYALFAETDRSILREEHSKSGIVVQTSIATEWTYRDFFKQVVDNRELVSLYDFQNRRSNGTLWFQGVDSRLQFCLFTLCRSATPEARVSFFTDTVDRIYTGDKVYQLRSGDISRINPNTLTVPVFRYPRDAALTRKIYRSIPAMVVEEDNRNDWQVILKQGLFNISGASRHFLEQQELAEKGLCLKGNRYVDGDKSEWLPVYEDWMVHQFDHRYNSHGADYTTNSEHSDAEFLPLPRYWIERSKTLQEALVLHQSDFDMPNQVSMGT